MVFTIIIAIVCICIFFYSRQAQFGKKATGERLDRMRRSANFRDGKFHNQHLTPSLTEGYSMWKVFYEFFFKKNKGRKPQGLIPSVKTDLHTLATNVNTLVWFGHSSYFIRLDGKSFLVDPVFSGNASPIPGSNKAFQGADIYKAADMPFIDCLFISHDHYDHADYKTLVELKAKIKKVVCGLGVGAHLEHWGFNHDIITEMDWNEQYILETGFIITSTPARHFSGRGLRRNQTLWLSFLLQSPSLKIFIGGDSGYDTHFKEIGNKYGPIDLVILEAGQYDIKWKYIHMLLPEVLQAAKDLGARSLLPVHSSKFAMANHRWDEPLSMLTKLNERTGIPLLTPVIGAAVNLSKEIKPYRKWWEEVEK